MFEVKADNSFAKRSSLALQIKIIEDDKFVFVLVWKRRSFSSALMIFELGHVVCQFHRLSNPYRSVRQKTYRRIWGACCWLFNLLSGFIWCYDNIYIDSIFLFAFRRVSTLNTKAMQRESESEKFFQPFSLHRFRIYKYKCESMFGVKNKSKFFFPTSARASTFYLLILVGSVETGKWICKKGVDVVWFECLMMGSPNEELTGNCFVCDKVSKSRCSQCLDVFYCSVDHQRKDWKSHKPKCSPMRTCNNDKIGRHYVTTRNIKPGEVVLREAPLVIGPSQATPPVCVGCLQVKFYNICNNCVRVQVASSKVLWPRTAATFMSHECTTRTFHNWLTHMVQKCRLKLALCHP